MGSRTTDRPPVANLGIADLARGAGQQGQLLLEQVGELDVVVAGQRPDRDVPVVLANVVKVADPADVDQERRRREPELHQRDQAVTAGQDFCLLAMLDQLRHRLRERTRGDVVERGWNHRFVPPLRCIRCQIFSGVAGMSTSLTPNGDRASTIALMTATLDAIVPASPIPLTPSGLVGLGGTVAGVSYDGRSGAVGIM